MSTSIPICNSKGCLFLVVLLTATSCSKQLDMRLATRPLSNEVQLRHGGRTAQSDPLSMQVNGLEVPSDAGLASCVPDTGLNPSRASAVSDSTFGQRNWKGVQMTADIFDGDSGFIDSQQYNSFEEQNAVVDRRTKGNTERWIRVIVPILAIGLTIALMAITFRGDIGGGMW